MASSFKTSSDVVWQGSIYCKHKATFKTQYQLLWGVLCRESCRGLKRIDLYSDSQDYALHRPPQLTVPLTDVLKVMCREAKAHRSAFQVLATSNKYHFATQTIGERNSWMSQLDKMLFGPPEPGIIYDFQVQILHNTDAERLKMIGRYILKISEEEIALYGANGVLRTRFSCHLTEIIRTRYMNYTNTGERVLVIYTRSASCVGEGTFVFQAPSAAFVSSVIDHRVKEIHSRVGGRSPYVVDSEPPSRTLNLYKSTVSVRPHSPHLHTITLPRWQTLSRKKRPKQVAKRGRSPQCLSTTLGEDGTLAMENGIQPRLDGNPGESSYHFSHDMADARPNSVPTHYENLSQLEEKASTFGPTLVHDHLPPFTPVPHPLPFVPEKKPMPLPRRGVSVSPPDIDAPIIGSYSNQRPPACETDTNLEHPLEWLGGSAREEETRKQERWGEGMNGWREEEEEEEIDVPERDGECQGGNQEQDTLGETESLEDQLEQLRLQPAATIPEIVNSSEDDDDAFFDQYSYLKIAHFPSEPTEGTNRVHSSDDESLDLEETSYLQILPPDDGQASGAGFTEGGEDGTISPYHVFNLTPSSGHSPLQSSPLFPERAGDWDDHSPSSNVYCEIDPTFQSETNSSSYPPVAGHFPPCPCKAHQLSVHQSRNSERVDEAESVKLTQKLLLQHTKLAPSYSANILSHGNRGKRANIDLDQVTYEHEWQTSSTEEEDWARTDRNALDTTANGAARPNQTTNRTETVRHRIARNRLIVPGRDSPLFNGEHDYCKSESTFHQPRTQATTAACYRDTTIDWVLQRRNMVLQWRNGSEGNDSTVGDDCHVYDTLYSKRGSVDSQGYATFGRGLLSLSDSANSDQLQYSLGSRPPAPLPTGVVETPITLPSGDHSLFEKAFSTARQVRLRDVQGTRMHFKSRSTEDICRVSNISEDSDITHETLYEYVPPDELRRVYRNQLPDPELGGYIGLGSTPPARRQLDGARTATNQTAAAWESVTVTSQIGGHRVIANSGQL